MKKRIVELLVVCISALWAIGCDKDTSSTEVNLHHDKTPISESDTIVIPKYTPEKLNEAATEDIKNWITFKELNNAVLTIGADEYTKKIKIERTNYLIWSEQFDNARWLKKSADIVKDTLIPFGKNGKTADGFNANNMSSYHYMSQSYAIREKDTVTLSVFAKAGEASFLYLSGETVDPTEQKTGVFDLSNGTVAFTPDGFYSSIEDKGDGWYLCAFTFLSNPRGRAVIGASQSSSQFVFESTDAIDIYTWGAQLENNTSVGNYLPTTQDYNSVEERINYVPKEKELQIINSSYQKLYFQVDDIYRNVVDVETKNMPEKYKTPFILSRLRNLKTHTLLLTDALQNNSFLTNEEVNKMLNDIYKTYNSILWQINNLNDTSLEQNMDAILKRQQE